MTPIDPRKLLHFSTIVEQGSFNKAAKLLGVSQPALSTAITRLEKSIGDKLLFRSPNGVHPTQLGEALYAHARLMRDELENAEQRLRRAAPAEESSVTLGALPSLASSIVPAAICRWRIRYPAMTLRVVERNQLGLLLALLRGELNFVIAQTELYGFLDGMRQRVLFRDRLHIIGRAEHPALRLQTPTWADLAVYPWVVQMVGRHRTVLDRLMAEAGVTLSEQLTECGSPEFIKRLVVSSDNLAMLPASAVADDVRYGWIRPINITTPALNRDIAVLLREGAVLSEADRDLLTEIEKVGSSLDEGLARQS